MDSYDLDYFSYILSSFKNLSKEEAERILSQTTSELKKEIGLVEDGPAINRRLLARVTASLIVQGVESVYVNKVTKTPPSEGTRAYPVTYIVLSKPSLEMGERWATIGLRLMDSDAFNMKISRGSFISLKLHIEDDKSQAPYKARIDFFPRDMSSQARLGVEFKYSSVEITVEKSGETDTIEEVRGIIVSVKDYVSEEGMFKSYCTLLTSRETVRGVAFDSLPVGKPLLLKVRKGEKYWFINSATPLDKRESEDFIRSVMKDFDWLISEDPGAGVVSLVVTDIGQREIAVSDGGRETFLRVGFQGCEERLSKYLFKRVNLLVEKTPPRTVESEGRMREYSTTAWLRGIVEV